MFTDLPKDSSPCAFRPKPWTCAHGTRRKIASWDAPSRGVTAFGGLVRASVKRLADEGRMRRFARNVKCPVLGSPGARFAWGIMRERSSPISAIISLRSLIARGPFQAPVAASRVLVEVTPFASAHDLSWMPFRRSPATNVS